MTKLPEILAAFAALAKALPASPGAYVNVNMHGCSDDDVDLLASVEGAKLETGTDERKTRTWRYAELRHNGVTLVAYGPHRLLARADSDAIDAALKQAAKALS